MKQFEPTIDQCIHAYEIHIDLLRYENKKFRQKIHENALSIKDARAEIKRLKEEKKNGLQGH